VQDELVGDRVGGADGIACDFAVALRRVAIAGVEESAFLEDRDVERAARDEILLSRLPANRPGGPDRRLGPSESGGHTPLTPLNGASGTSILSLTTAALRLVSIR
jgi:hypothetical protein